MSWSQIQAQLEAADNGELLRLLRELHDLSQENQHFLSARFVAVTPEAKAAPYRQIISAVFNPSQGVPSLDLEAADKAVSTFKKVGAGPLAAIDLMLFYVEQGIICTKTYGDIHESFCVSLEDCYLDAANALLALDDPAATAALRPRFARICHSIDTVGWGLYENLTDTYYNILQFDSLDVG